MVYSIPLCLSIWLFYSKLKKINDFKDTCKHHSNSITITWSKAGNVFQCSLKHAKQLIHPFNLCLPVQKKLTLDWFVILSFAKYTRANGPKGRNNSCKSDSHASSERFVTLSVAASSAKYGFQIDIIKRRMTC